MKARFMFVVCLAMAVGFWGCNLFSPFYSEGSSDDPEALLSDARAALRDGRPQDALNMLDRAKDKLGPNPSMSTTSSQVFYFHAVATVRANNVSFQQFIDMMQAAGAGNLSKSGDPVNSPQDEIILFNFNAQELANLLRIFYAVQLDLLPVVDALRSGTLSPAQFPYTDDAYLSCAVASLVAGFIIMLDQDHNPANGFQLDSRLALKKLNDTYQLLLTDPLKTAQQIRQETVSIINSVYKTYLEAGLTYLWHYYNWSTFGKLKGNPPLPPTALPANLQSTASGIFFQVVHAGLTALYQYTQGG